MNRQTMDMYLRFWCLYLFSRSRLLRVGLIVPIGCRVWVSGFGPPVSFESYGCLSGTVCNSVPTYAMVFSNPKATS